MRYNMLIVEDNAFTANLVSTLFEGLGFDPHIIADGALALPYMEKNQVDIVILDLELPGKTGDQIYIGMKHNPVLRNIPVVPFTAHRDTDVAGTMPSILVTAAWNTTKKIPNIVFKSTDSGDTKDVNTQLILEVIGALDEAHKPPTVELAEWFADLRNISTDDFGDEK